MDIILYRHLLRRIVTYPITFSRNKNFDSYSSIEGKEAIKRAKVIIYLLEYLEENTPSCKKNKDNYQIFINHEKIRSKDTYILDFFEFDLIMENLDNRKHLLLLINCSK